MKPKISCTKIGVDSYAVYVKFPNEKGNSTCQRELRISNSVQCIVDMNEKKKPVGLEILYWGPRRKT